MRELVLGLQCDGPTWPETASGAPSDVGSAVVGPLGFLEAVETATGLRGPEVAPVRRIAAMRAKLEAAGGGRFWSRSPATDPWATARAVLRMRDELVECGWTRFAEPAWPVRLQDLAAANAAGPALPRGRSDRIAAACDRLRARPRLPWSAIRRRWCTRWMEGEMTPARVRYATTRWQRADFGRVQRLMPAAEPCITKGTGTAEATDATVAAFESFLGGVAGQPFDRS